MPFSRPVLPKKVPMLLSAMVSAFKVPSTLKASSPLASLVGLEMKRERASRSIFWLNDRVLRMDNVASLVTVSRIVSSAASKAVAGVVVGARTVMVTVSAALEAVPSNMVNEKVRVMSGSPVIRVGAVKVGRVSFGLDKVTIGALFWVWVQLCVIGSLSGSEDAEPSSVTMAPDATVWSGPALATGALLFGKGVTALEAVEATPVPAELVAVTVKVYGVPLVNPLTVIGEELPDDVIPPGLDVTV